MGDNRMTQVNMSTCFLLHSYCYFNIDLLFHVTKKKRCIFMKNKKPNSYAASISLRSKHVEWQKDQVC